METDTIDIKWLGHSCFRFECGGHSLMTDPYRDVPGLPDVDAEAGEVFASHTQHMDHGYFDGVRIVEEPGESPFETEDIPTFHDDKNGTLRGVNTVRRFLAAGMCLEHFGDIGHQLSPEQAKEASGADLAMVPVGGFFTVDAAGAAEIVRDTDPRIVIPMHYRDEKMGYEVISGREPFLELMSDRRIIHLSGDTFTLADLGGGVLEIRTTKDGTFTLGIDERAVLVPEIG